MQIRLKPGGKLWDVSTMEHRIMPIEEPEAKILMTKLILMGASDAYGTSAFDPHSFNWMVAQRTNGSWHIQTKYIKKFYQRYLAGIT